MVNVGLNSGSLLGFLLAIAGAGLYFLRSVRPELARDHDIFFAAIGLLCGFILIFQGWRLDPILQFGQVLLSGSTIFFAVESIRLRGLATEQAKRNTPIVDEERTVSRRYYQEAELDEYEPIEDMPPVRGRIRPSADSRPSRDPYESEPRRRPSSSSRPRGDRPDSRPDGRPERGSSADSALDRSSRKRRPRPEATRDDWGEVSVDWEEKPSRRPSGGSGGSSSGSSSRRPANIGDEDRETPRRTRRPRPTGEAPSRRRPEPESPPADYVDYQPVNYSEDVDRPVSEDDSTEDNRNERDDTYGYPVRNEDNRDERDDTYDYPVR